MLVLTLRSGSHGEDKDEALQGFDMSGVQGKAHSVHGEVDSLGRCPYGEAESGG